MNETELIQLIQNNNKSVDIVVSLWIGLFSLIIIQKLFKYIIKPIANRNNQENNNNNNNNNNTVNRDPSAECMIV